MGLCLSRVVSFKFLLVLANKVFLFSHFLSLLAFSGFNSSKSGLGLVLSEISRDAALLFPHAGMKRMLKRTGRRSKQFGFCQCEMNVLISGSLWQSSANTVILLPAVRTGQERPDRWLSPTSSQWGKGFHISPALFPLLCPATQPDSYMGKEWSAHIKPLVSRRINVTQGKSPGCRWAPLKE